MKSSKKKKRRIFLLILLLLFLISATICGWQLYLNYKEDAAADAAIAEIQGLKPIDQKGSNNADGDNLPLMDFTSMQSENPDIITWLTIPGTVIDYPVVQTADNDYYLYRDVQKRDNKNGALFLDYRVRANFSDFNNVIYGHHMESGLMFQNLIKFKEKSFFDRHTFGILYTPGKTYELEIFAVAVIRPNSKWYEYAFPTVKDQNEHLQRIKNDAIYCREIGLTTNDRIIMLSTCSYEFNDARTVVAARLIG